MCCYELTNDIEKIRAELNRMVINPQADENSLLALSRKLDKLIIEYYKSCSQNVG